LPTAWRFSFGSDTGASDSKIVCAPSSSSAGVSSTSEKTRKKHVETLSKRIRKYKEKQKRKNRRLILRMQRTAVGSFIFRIFKEPLASKKTEK
jgi:hypothetical protein